MYEVGRQAVTGVVPPQLGEALIRQTFPSVAAYPVVAGLGRRLILSYLAAPLGWFVMLPFYFLKILPFVARRYTLTNKRLMVQRGLWPLAVQEVPLTDIDEVRVKKDDNSDFFRAGDLEIISKDQVVLTLAGVPEPEAFRHAILNARNAWVPGKFKGAFVPAKAP